MEIKKGNVNEEKHVPFIEELENGYKVTIGKPAIHPMVEGHLIEYIELYVDGKFAGRRDFKPGELPIAEFESVKGSEVYALEYCNIHGVWQGEL